MRARQEALGHVQTVGFGFPVYTVNTGMVIQKSDFGNA